MMTFEHFCDRPTWAAAAGYDFNIIDCMSEAAGRASVWEGVLTLISATPDLELRTAWWELPLNILVVLILLCWPLLFWLLGFATYFRCRRIREKFYGSDDKTVQANLRGWLRDFEWQRQRKMKGKAS